MSGRVLFDELTKLQNFFEAPRLTHDLCSGHSEGLRVRAVGWLGPKPLLVFRIHHDHLVVWVAN